MINLEVILFFFIAIHCATPILSISHGKFSLSRALPRAHNVAILPLASHYSYFSSQHDKKGSKIDPFILHIHFQIIMRDCNSDCIADQKVSKCGTEFDSITAHFSYDEQRQIAIGCCANRDCCL